MNDKKQVKITLTSKQEDVEEAVTQYYFGEMYVKGQAIYIKYIEMVEQQEIRHLIRYGPNELKITRHGLVQSEQTYRLHEHRIGTFDNKMIKLQVDAYTTSLALKDAHNHTILGIPQTLPFYLYFSYDLYVDEQMTGSFEIRLTIEEANV